VAKEYFRFADIKENKMKKKTGILLAAIILITCLNCGDKMSSQTEQDKKAQKQQAADRINILLDDYNKNVKKGQYQLCLTTLEEILDICKKNSLRKDFILSMTDEKQFILQKLERFDEALKVAFELEEMSQKSGKRKSPWNYLKIADSYLGLQNIEKTIQWMEKAVYERGFKKHKLFEQEKYERLHSNKSFQKLLKHMKDSIGLQQPAKDFIINLLDGKKFELSSLKGKVVLIDFWNVYCLPCVKALPELKDLYNQYKKKFGNHWH